MHWKFEGCIAHVSRSEPLVLKLVGYSARRFPVVNAGPQKASRSLATRSAVIRTLATRRLTGAHVRAQLQQYPQFVGTAPALDDLAFLEPRNVHSAGSDVPTGGRDPSELAVMGAADRIGDSNVSLVLHEAIDRHR